VNDRFPSRDRISRHNRPPVLVTDGEERAALAITRSLGRQGYPVYVTSVRGSSLAGSSRFAAAHATVPDPLVDPQEFVNVLSRLSAGWGTRVIIPVSEPALLAVLAARDRFPDAEIPFADANTFRDICDKTRVLQVAAETGIAVPSQRTLRSREDALTFDVASLPFPLVLKPGRSIGGQEGGRMKLSVSYAYGPADLRRQLAEIPEAAFPLLLQQRIVGPGVGIFLFLWQGRTLASFAHRRLREKPPSGGASVYRESVAADPTLLRLSTELLQRFAWDGVAMVEYKIDRVTNVPYLMEINGRFWGSLQLAVDAGVDFPGKLVSAALGEPVEPQTDYRIGIRSRWWWGDFDRLLSLLRRSRLALALPLDAPPRWRSILEFFILWRPGDRNEIFRWTDLAPFLHESIDWFTRL
jgi:predicted ATP-grasp superfamily ATP-dependent carboligase